MAKAKPTQYTEEFMSLHDLLTSINQHLSNIEGSVQVIRRTAEDTNVRVKQREKARKAHGEVPKASR